MELIEKFKAARRVSTPLIGIETPDQLATIEQISLPVVNGSNPLLRWDIAQGLRALNPEGQDALAKVLENLDPQDLAKVLDGRDPSATNRPGEALALAGSLPGGSVLFFLNAHRFVSESEADRANGEIAQAVLNLRERFKMNRRTLVLLAPSFSLPVELAQDIMVFSENLPGEEQLKGIVLSQYGIVAEKYNLPALEEKTLVIAVDALRGLASFPAEQITAMSLVKGSKGSIDLGAMWERKIKQVEQTPGLTVDKGKESFDDVIGLEDLLALGKGIFEGRNPPKLVVRLDEIEKSIAGAGKGSVGDSSGTSQDALGVVLREMEDNGYTGLIAVGAPGTGKSLVTKALAGQFGCLSIALDMGAAKGSLVGQSEANIRQAMKIIFALAGLGGAFFVATCNNISALPPELIARFSFGLWEVEKPGKQARLAMWRLHCEKKGLPAPSENDLPDDSAFVGREIRNCVDLAWRMGCSLKEASRFVSVGGKPLKATRPRWGGSASEQKIDL